jgi:hypothetical protein
MAHRLERRSSSLARIVKDNVAEEKQSPIFVFLGFLVGEMKDRCCFVLSRFVWFCLVFFFFFFSRVFSVIAQNAVFCLVALGICVLSCVADMFFFSF